MGRWGIPVPEEKHWLSASVGDSHHLHTKCLQEELDGVQLLRLQPRAHSPVPQHGPFSFCKLLCSEFRAPLAGRMLCTQQLAQHIAWFIKSGSSTPIHRVASLLLIQNHLLIHSALLAMLCHPPSHNPSCRLLSEGSKFSEVNLPAQHRGPAPQAKLLPAAHNHPAQLPSWPRATQLTSP